MKIWEACWSLKLGGRAEGENEVRTLAFLALVVHADLRVLLPMLFFPSSKQTKETKTQVSSSEDDTSPPPVLPLALDFSPEKAAAEVAENKIKEAEVQNQPAEEKQTEVKNDNTFFYRPTK